MTGYDTNTYYMIWYDILCCCFKETCLEFKSFINLVTILKARLENLRLKVRTLFLEQRQYQKVFPIASVNVFLKKTNRQYINLTFIACSTSEKTSWWPLSRLSAWQTRIKNLHMQTHLDSSYTSCLKVSKQAKKEDPLEAFKTNERILQSCFGQLQEFQYDDSEKK